MNFFAQQERARTKTTWLVTFLVAAVVSLIAITSLAVAVFVYILQNGSNSYSASQAINTSAAEHIRALLTLELVGTVGAIVLIVVIGSSLFKLMQLSRGGKEVALALGGRLLNTDTRDADERKILNVVEEMAIASGNPVPSVYLLEEPGINAFAAGFGRRDAVIGITRGCISQLSRDELQGVIAHEFSHIHFGDMQLNMRLIALLHGILVIGLIGYFLLRSSGASRRKNAGAQLGLGLALVIIGYCGTFFGNIIKAAVSRQREFLADASAVQFTRNPDGIAGALKKIGGSINGSTLENSHASEYSHLYFSNGVNRALASVLATHPPLEERIKRIDARWDGRFIQPKAQPQSQPKPTMESPQSDSATGRAAAFTGALTAGLMAAQIDNQVGNPSAEHIGYAQALLHELPDDIARAAHEPFTARALMFALLLDDDEALRNVQLVHLRAAAHPATFTALNKLVAPVKQLARTQHLPLIELAMPALKQLSQPQYRVFKANLTALIRADKKVSLFEWTLYRILTHGIENKRTSHTTHLAKQHRNSQILLSMTCYAGGSAQPGTAFHAGAKMLGLPSDHDLIRQDDLDFRAVDQALSVLAGMAPLEKPKLLKAIAACINTDGKITADEAELFRAVADSLDCPMPPLLAT